MLCICSDIDDNGDRFVADRGGKICNRSIKGAPLAILVRTREMSIKFKWQSSCCDSCVSKCSSVAVRLSLPRVKVAVAVELRAVTGAFRFFLLGEIRLIP